MLNTFKSIKGFIFDMDGVLTDGSLILTADGEMARTMYVKDGYAMQLAIKKGYMVAVISGGTSAAAALRLENLGVKDIYMGVKNKQECFEELLKKYNLSPGEVLVMGDDIPDIPVLLQAGLPACPSDAVSEVEKIATYISPYAGGKGCVRDVIEKVMKLNGHWQIDVTIASK